MRGTFLCVCADGWLGIRCAYREYQRVEWRSIADVLLQFREPWRSSFLWGTIHSTIWRSLISASCFPIPPSTQWTSKPFGRCVFRSSSNLLSFPNDRPDLNNTIIITVIVSGTNVPNVTFPNVHNVIDEPTKSTSKNTVESLRHGTRFLDINSCVFLFIYNNRSYTSCIPIARSHSAYCCQNANCDLYPQWQFCNTSSMSSHFLVSCPFVSARCLCGLCSVVWLHDQFGWHHYLHLSTWFHRSTLWCTYVSIDCENGVE